MLWLLGSFGSASVRSRTLISVIPPVSRLSAVVLSPRRDANAAQTAASVAPIAAKMLIREVRWATPEGSHEWLGRTCVFGKDARVDDLPRVFDGFNRSST